MNMIKAVCGHMVPAIGAPNSKEREYCESVVCQQCQKEFDELMDSGPISNDFLNVLPAQVKVKSGEAD